jgi:hypothetical protein
VASLCKLLYKEIKMTFALGVGWSEGSPFQLSKVFYKICKLLYKEIKMTFALGVGWSEG